MTEREKDLETILKQLLTQHFWSTDLHCSLHSGESIKSANIELYIFRLHKRFQKQSCFINRRKLNEPLPQYP